MKKPLQYFIEVAFFIQVSEVLKTSDTLIFEGILFTKRSTQKKQLHLY